MRSHTGTLARAARQRRVGRCSPRVQLMVVVLAAGATAAAIAMAVAARADEGGTSYVAGVLLAVAGLATTVTIATAERRSVPGGNRRMTPRLWVRAVGVSASCLLGAAAIAAAR